MAFVSLIFTALNLRKVQEELIEEKLDAIKADEDKTFKKKFRFRHIGVDIKVACYRFLRKLCICRCSENSKIQRTCYKLQHEGSCENYVLKSAFGFIGGVLLTYLLYIFFIFQLNVKLTTATVVCSFLGCLLTVGLAFSSKIRCVVLLIIPQFFSKRGRQALLAYAFALALTGPAQNTLNNMGILSESLACGQEQLKQAVKQIIDVIKKPFVAIKEAIKKVIKTVKEVVKKIKEILLKIKRIIMALVRVIKSVFEFLGKIINICNKELGTPFERCTRVFENAIADCNAKLGPLFNWLCSLTYIVKAVCYIVKVFDYVCMLVDFISNSVVGVVIRKVKTFVRHIKTMFYVRIKFSHSFKFETTSSKSITEIAKAIVAEIKQRSRGVVAFFNFMTSAAMLFFLYIVFQVTYYRIRYLTSERFDNIYITKTFREIDLRRAKLGKDTILPLNKKETRIYVPIASGMLAQTERKKLSKAVVALATASVKLGTHMAADYCLYWILTMITYHGRYQSKIQAPNLPVAHITGEGFIAKLLRSIVDAFQPVGIKLEIDTVPCLPIPIPPDFDRYVQIAITILICWILTILEPYGLRFRSYIMGYYHPIRAKQRTIWLYNHILRSRSSFLLFARRQLRRKFGDKGIEQVSCKDHLRAKLNCAIFKICFGEYQLACLLCGEVLRYNDQKRFIKCHSPGCPGLFCLECFADLKNICPVCLSPIEYGDLDNLDEEKDSSGDEKPKKPKKKRKCPWFSCGKPDDDDNVPLISEDEEEEEYQEKEKKEEQKEEKTEERQEEKPKEKLVECKCEESDSSTDYSCTYQYDEDQQPYPKTICFKDVEKQNIPDYASMESFRDEEEILSIDLENKIRVPKGHAALVRMNVSASVSDENVGEEPYQDDREMELLSINTLECICPDSSEKSSPRRVEFIGLPQELKDVHKSVKRKIKIIPSDSMCCCSELDLIEHLEETDLITLPKSTMSTSTRSDCKYCRREEEEFCSCVDIGTETEEELRNIVPKLDLSFLHKDNKASTCDNPILSQRFGANVKYEEICETPPNPLSNRSLDSSSLLSSLENSPPTEQTPMLRRRNVKVQYRTPLPDASSPSDIDTPTRLIKQKNARTQYTAPEEVNSSSSMDSYEFNKAQNRKVRQYYETTNRMQLDNTTCQCKAQGRSLRNVFRRFLPKRKIQQNYLPLHRRDIDEDTQVRSYNYYQQNWDTLSLDTDSPTYPFGTQLSSDTSEEDRHLLGERRIRGGECTHLINCRLIGRTCPQKRVRSFDAKSRTLLKDFSSLSLPPRPKPANTKEFLDKYFLTIVKPVDVNNLGLPMKSAETDKGVALKQNSNLIEIEESSDLIDIKSGVSTISIPEDNTPSSSDSGLSEDTCIALFGGPCPGGLGKPDNLDSASADRRSKEKEENVDSEEENVDSEEESPLTGPEITFITSQKESSDKTGVDKGEGTTRTEQNNKTQQSTGSDLTDKIKSQESQSTREELKRPSEDKEHSKTSDLNQIEEQPSTSQVARQPAKRKSTQLNQLLYKDEKTEISLVQKLSPDKGGKSNPSLQLSHRKVPSVKLKIALHNSIVKEDEREELDVIEMKSPKSKDKIVETQESFPLHHDWESSDSSRTGKLILASDKIQQTSDNDIYHSSRATSSSDRKKFSSSRIQSSTSVHTHPKVSSTSGPRYSSSDPQYPTSDPYYSSEEPERDCVNNCRCARCREKQHRGPTVQEGCSHNCCQCPNQKYPSTPVYQGPIPPPFERSFPVRPRERNYRINTMPPTTSESEPLPLPPPPPPPRPQYLQRSKKPPRQRPRLYSDPSCTGCNCCLKQRHVESHAYSGDYELPSTSRRYSTPRTRPSYGYEREYDQSYNTTTEDDQYNYPNANRQSSLTELPYQNNEEYLELVEELQDTLHTRNRNRVKRAMQEFEDRSKHNRPLEKPIINYDETSESEEPIIRKIDQLRTDRKICCAEEQCTCIKQRSSSYSDPNQRKCSSRRERFEPDERPSHWTMDPNSGEWSKACKCFKKRPKGAKGRGEPKQCFCNCERSRYQ